MTKVFAYSLLAGGFLWLCDFDMVVKDGLFCCCDMGLKMQ